MVLCQPDRNQKRERKKRENKREREGGLAKMDDSVFLKGGKMREKQTEMNCFLQADVSSSHLKSVMTERPKCEYF